MMEKVVSKDSQRSPLPKLGAGDGKDWVTWTSSSTNQLDYISGVSSQKRNINKEEINHPKTVAMGIVGEERPNLISS